MCEKIPKTDVRFTVMEELFDLRKGCLQEGFYKDGTFRYALFVPEKNKHLSFSFTKYVYRIHFRE
jgi:hypothetical protein